ncbi:SMP-30/gluconolactonase/LRE family protein [Streptomyces sp. PSKA54]|uniref:SMP-30/gluconolactonase/LRE family protein n=1 Tax=Streptomyces himalayensis subsp. aureolus TaxID=2758039 RepID=A0A7W2D7H1_9ACTN|nr:SMP-30/gluconolactonase/LRE family protein [Streptomyces himalayensis]MBA4866078.1 SMP-30/gluconolactonase/LRE family protein [Streptomyces himalayensis subsp. aureolus]
MTGDARPLSPWSDRLVLGESARWVGGRLVLVDILTGRLLEAPAGDRAGAAADAPGESPAALRTIAELPFHLGAVAPVADAPGSWIAAAGTGICLLSPDGGIDWLARPEDDNPVESRMNDGVADPSGRFWAGSMAYDVTPGAGCLYRVDPGGCVTRVLDGITVPNGPAFNGDGSLMYLADSARSTVHRYPVDASSGALGRPEVFVTLAAGEGKPDGMTVDREGGVWIAIWGAGAVHRYRPDGALDRVIGLPAPQPTSVCLGGRDGRVLHITSASVGRDPAQPYEGAVFRVQVEVPGPPARCYRRERDR